LVNTGFEKQKPKEANQISKRNKKLRKNCKPENTQLQLSTARKKLV